MWVRGRLGLPRFGSVWARSAPGSVRSGVGSGLIGFGSGSFRLDSGSVRFGLGLVENRCLEIRI